MEDKIVIYQTSDGETSIDVKLENETVWLTQRQMAELFQTTSQNVTLHIKNLYEEKELEESSTCKDFLQVHQEGTRSVKRNRKFYNLDVIISVGYRVKSQRGTQFRIWANKVLKEYLINGYAINNKLVSQKYEELRQLVSVLGRAFKQHNRMTSDEVNALINVVTDYNYALDILDKYDYQKLVVEQTTIKERFHATYDNAMEAIACMKKKFGNSSLFGNEKDESFKSSIGQIYQTFEGVDLYPSVEEKAAMLLYLVTKNHSFIDGNKRIAAALFLWFMNNNDILYDNMGNKRIADNTLVALTLMIAESRTEEKDIMVKVVVNLINKDN